MRKGVELKLGLLRSAGGAGYIHRRSFLPRNCIEGKASEPIKQAPIPALLNFQPSSSLPLLIQLPTSFDYSQPS